jgi:hypothetical protein
MSFILAFPKSPFERELQRLLNESAKNKMMPTQSTVNKTNNLDSTKKTANHMNNNGNASFSKSKLTNSSALVGSYPSTSSNVNNNNIKPKESDESCIDTNSLKHHKVGLDAIKEMTKKNTDYT